MIIFLKNNENSREDIAPHPIISPPYFPIGTKHSTWNASAGIRKTNARLVVWNDVSEDSSDQMTYSHHYGRRKIHF
ncbi:hypothetical protein TNCV_1147581 [Trichonephila clavipes]|nr:hypothetical protein TNCV_1147581 [Trichonephila clavipes]